MLPVDKIITWTSSSSGSSRSKTGVILAYVPAKADIFALSQLASVPRARYRTNIQAQTSRSARYLIRVDRGDQYADEHRYEFYAPYAGVVESQNQQASALAPSAPPPPPPSAAATARTASAPSWPCAQPSSWGNSTLMPVPPPKPAEPEPTPAPQPAQPAPELRNRFVLVVDKSTSIQAYRLTDRVRELVNENLATIRRETQATGQKTTVTVVLFGSAGDIRTLVNNVSIEEVKPLTVSDYRPHGNTALLDGVGLTIQNLLRQKDSADPNLSTTVITLTDGEENDSKRISAETLRDLLATTQATDRWNHAFLLPPGRAAIFARQYGVPEGNVSEWSQTADGVEAASKAAQAGVASVYAGRAQGKTSTRSFFTTDLSQIKPTDLAQLDDLTARFKTWQVEKETDIDAFFRFHTNQYVIGSGYYLLTKPEDVQDHKNILLMEKGKKRVYGGPKVRALLGLTSTGTVRVTPGNHSNYDIYVQSKSVNRKLVRGTRMLYDVGHTVSSDPTWTPPTAPTAAN